MGKKVALHRFRWIFLGFIFAIIIFSGFFLARIFNNEPANYPTTPQEVVEDFYTWYFECTNGEFENPHANSLLGNCNYQTNYHIERDLHSRLKDKNANIACSTESLKSFKTSDIVTEGEKSEIHIHAITQREQTVHIGVHVSKIRGIWKIVDVDCGYD